MPPPRHRARPFTAVRAALSPQYLFFGGKGGTGKTTCAAAAAITFAEQGRKLLIVSTDPAHSLGDALGRKLTARPSAIQVRRGRLDACELDADRALVRWLAFASAQRHASAARSPRSSAIPSGSATPAPLCWQTRSPLLHGMWPD